MAILLSINDFLRETENLDKLTQIKIEDSDGKKRDIKSLIYNIKKEYTRYINGELGNTETKDLIIKLE
jgi:hypothetical protein